ncbi:cation:proton antiporter [Jiulongibacter sediminis]|uniref:cation:proton antiporter domain-containing protein n=1 Tax=Jiulongibacter sediminis TaxID=1605367 RepID=UPI0026F32F20|nr:cation:proton antiporter [Jiulongibacter sediminis]
MNTNYLILALCIIVMLSYLYNIISRKSRIPSVLWLLGTGILVNYFDGEGLASPGVIDKAVQVLGTVGLIVIILEAALDLHVEKGKIILITRAFVSALVILVLSSFAIAYIISGWLGDDFMNCLVYATPLSIVSSAIVIPSVGMLTESTKEFIIYEAAFSDILGILYFNYLIGAEEFTIGNGAIYLGQMLISILVSIGVAILLIFLLSKISQQIKFFLIFAVLVALYAFGKIIHLPSLLIILFFGLIINNRHLLNVLPYTNKVIPNGRRFKHLEEQTKVITLETSFIVRTFFFILFGYSIDLQKMVQTEVLAVGTFIVLTLLVVRLIFLKYINPKESPLPELFLMPRGLITILLFYNIPDEYRLADFNNGILFFVIMVTSFMMMIGLFSASKDVVADVESSKSIH